MISEVLSQLPVVGTSGPWLAIRRRISTGIAQARDPANLRRLAESYRQSQWLSSEELQAFQKESLRELIAHCAARVPYYRHLFGSMGWTRPDQVEFTRLPILTKDTLRRGFDALKSDDLSTREWYLNRSGGSTGEPVTVVQDSRYADHSRAKKDLCLSWAGWETGEPLIRLWGSERDILKGGVGFRPRLRQFAGNRWVLNAFRLTPQTMTTYLKLLNRNAPSVVHAYTSAIYSLAVFARQRGITVAPHRAVVTTSETLYPEVRYTIERVFGCRVFDQYGSREVSCLASECERHEGLHVNVETLFVEILDDDKNPCPPGQEGSIVVTPLTNHAMPLLRYEIGDRGTWADRPCGCGRGLPVLACVGGRSIDRFRRADGTVIPAEYFIHFVGVVLNRGDVAKMQFIQHDYDLVEVKLVTHGDKTVRPDTEEIQSTVQRVMGGECEVRVTFHDHIAPSPSGKHRYTICKLADG